MIMSFFASVSRAGRVACFHHIVERPNGIRQIVGNYFLRLFTLGGTAICFLAARARPGLSGHPPLDPQTSPPSRSRRNIFARSDHMGGQERWRKILWIQCHDEIGKASFSATAEGIVSWIRRDARQSSGRNKFRLLSQQIDDLPNEWTPDAQPSQDSFVFQKNLIAHQPDKSVSFDPIPEQIGARILGSDLG